MKNRTYTIYWLEYSKDTNMKTSRLPKYKKVTGTYCDGVIEVECCKKVKARNIDELIEIVRELKEDEGFETFTVFNPEGINILTETDLDRG